jgi:protoporphyrinogen oxidase
MTLRSLLYELVFPGAKTEHIDGSFLYPRRGYGRIVDALARTLPPESIRTGHSVESLECEGSFARRVRFADGASAEIEDRVVSTLPLPLLVERLGDALPDEARAAASRLRFRHVRLLFLRLSRARLTDKASIYIPDPAFCVSRIYEPRNRSAEMAPEGETSVVVEAPCFSADAVATEPPDAFLRRVVGELSKLRLLDPGDVLESRHHFVPNAYPVYSSDYGRQVAIVRDALARIENLDSIGRAGRFVYSHLHDQLRFGKDLVAAFLETRRAYSA